MSQRFSKIFVRGLCYNVPEPLTVTSWVSRLQVTFSTPPVAVLKLTSLTYDTKCPIPSLPGILVSAWVIDFTQLSQVIWTANMVYGWLAHAIFTKSIGSTWKPEIIVVIW